MEMLASCFLLHGAPPKSFKPHTLQGQGCTSSPPLTAHGRRSVSIVRSVQAHAGTGTNGYSIDVATGGSNTERPQGGDVVVVNGSGTSFDFELYLSAKAKAVDDALDAALWRRVRGPERLSESVRYSVLAAGGKRVRVRPVLAIAACELVGGEASAAAPVACAAEMIHAASLIQGDMPCMGDDAMRRGRRLANHATFGESTALLAGDALLAFAFEHVARGCAELGVPAERAVRAIAELGSAAGAGAAGHVADKASEGVAGVSLATLEYIQVHRTARLLEASAVSGAVVGGGNDEEIERVRRYARCIGLFFRVVDDVLDATRASGQVGKTAGKDMAGGGKATYSNLLGVERARAYATELLVEAFLELDGFDAGRAEPLRHLARLTAVWMK
ncbi:hypothetical protein ACP4OV_008841 [Aristida adscensionis]